MNEKFWTSGDQTSPYPTSRHSWNLLGAGVGVGTLALLGSPQIRPGYTGWDALLQGVRAVEEYSPAKMLRTFQLSQVLSPLETASRQFRYISPGRIASMLEQRGPQANWIKWISAQAGRDVSAQIIEKGVRFEGGQVLLGKTGGDVLLQHAYVARNLTGALPHAQEAQMRSLVGGGAASSYHGIFQQAVEFENAAGGIEKEVFHFFGGATKKQAGWRAAAGYGTSLVERFNRLLRDVESNKVIQKIPLLNKLKFSVKSGGGLETFGKLALKLGVGLPAAYLGYQEVDRWVRRQPQFDSTIFSEGITAGVGTLAVKAHLGISQVAETLGGHAWREAQESVAPGSTSLLSLAALPAIGALTASGIGYGKRLVDQIGLQKAGYGVGEASGVVEAARGLFRQKLYPKADISRLLEGLSEKGLREAEQRAAKWSSSWVGGVATKIASTQRRGGFVPWLSRALGEVTPGKIWGLGAAAAGAALILPFIPGALVPDKRPDELKKIYRGEQLEPVRKGRWWEFGRSPYEGEKIDYWRQNWYPRMLARGKEKAIWGEGEDEISPISKWIRENFTYELERCVEENTFILVPGGMTKIGDLQVGDQVFNQHGKVSTVEAKWEEVINGETVTLKVARSLPVTSTPEHKFLCLETGICFYNRKKEGQPTRCLGQVQREQCLECQHLTKPIVKWVRADQVKPNTHWLLQPKYLSTSFPQREQIDLLDQVPHSHYRLRDEDLISFNTSNVYVKRFVQFGYDFGYFIGVLLGDGSIRETIKVFCDSKDQALIHKVSIIIRNLFGISPTLFTCPDKQEVDICLNSRPIARWLRSLLYLDKQKYLGEKLRSSNKEYLLGLYEGLLDTDNIGKKNKNNEEGIINTSPHVIGLFQWLSFVFKKPAGIKVGLQEKQYCSKSGTIRNCHNSWIVSRSKAEKLRHIFETQDFYAFRVRDKITKHKPIKVVDIKVSEGFSFCTTSGIVHNTHYYDRPYPQTGTAFQDVPLIGPLLAATVGKLVKPPLLMHEQEWKREGIWSDETLSPPLKFGETPPIKELGETGPGSPVSAYRAAGVLGEQTYRITEMIGLPGFVAESLKKAVTGTGGIAEQESVLASAGDIYSPGRTYWDMSLGGVAGMSEAARRLYPRERNLDRYNPLQNQMPSWLPGAGERATNFQVGDPYAAIPEGEIRLPGEGLAAIYPELKGVNPEEYPDIWKMHVLADVAPYSESYGRIKGQVQAQVGAGHLNPEEVKHYQQILDRVEQQKKRKEFSPYEYTSTGSTASREALADINRRSGEEKSPSWFSRVVGGYWEKLSHGAETPMEYLTPISPAMKMVHRRSAIEDYERTQLYGTKSSFWDKPIENFIRPFAQSVAHAAGWEGIPEKTQQQRDVESYFDVLKYVKATRLEEAARDVGNPELINQYSRERRETLFGINPFSMDFSQVFRAMPRRERDYFSEFMKAGPEERKQILGMIPENERALYVAHWQTKDVQDWQKVALSGEASEQQIVQAETAMANLQESKQAGGFPQTEALWEEYVSQRKQNESYPDWYRRTYLLAKALKGRALPGPDWVGFDPRVDLEDVKMKVVEKIGGNTFDYDIWPDRIRAGATKPWLDQAASELQGSMGAGEARQRVLDILAAHDINIQQLAVLPARGNQNEVDVQFQEDRARDVRRGFKEMSRG